jgi:hypothetical protein
MRARPLDPGIRAATGADCDYGRPSRLGAVIQTLRPRAACRPVRLRSESSAAARRLEGCGRRRSGELWWGLESEGCLGRRVSRTRCQCTASTQVHVRVRAGVFLQLYEQQCFSRWHGGALLFWPGMPTLNPLDKRCSWESPGTLLKLMGSADTQSSNNLYEILCSCKSTDMKLPACRCSDSNDEGSEPLSHTHQQAKGCDGALGVRRNKLFPLL